MNIALIGYGKMGQAIEKIALERGHQVVLRIHIDNREQFTKENLSKADVAIEFTGPESAAANILCCLEFGVPVVCGSTGWLLQLPAIREAVAGHNGAFLYASNFSIGVNIFFEINKRLAQLLAPHPEYNVSLSEIHHTQKKDAPSGTAITLAEQVIAAGTIKKKWVNEQPADTDALFIESIREDPAPGTHTVKWQSEVDDIEIRHTAHNRTGFALGALLAAEFLPVQKGIFTMKDVLGL